MSGPRSPRENEAFPMFLTSDPYPSQPDSRPISSVSESTSTYETAASERSGGPPLSWSGAVGEVGDYPSRPTTATHTQSDGVPRASMPQPTSRRGHAPFSGRREEPMFIAGSRPSSSLGRSHVPSITAQGFFRPMSPATLQAQRNNNSSPTPFSQSPPVGVSSQPAPSPVVQPGSQQRRYSNASVNTLRDGPPPIRPGEAPPLPTSRGRSDLLAGSDADLGGPGQGSILSKNSTTPLHATRQYPSQSRESFKLSNLRGSTNSAQGQRSSKSFRASLGLQSRNSPTRPGFAERVLSAHGHEKLHSNPNSPDGSEPKKSLPKPPAPPVGRTRNYEYFAGNTLFFLRGHFLNTRAAPLNVLTLVLVVIPAILFFVASADWLWHNISPAMPLIFAYVFFLTLSSFLHAAFSDPGIYPRNLHPLPPNPEEARNPLAPGPPLTEWVMVRTYPRPAGKKVSAADAALAEAAQATAMEVPTKYCKTCQIWRPPRCHHCRICDLCVEGHDHHCVWLNQCVGKRNYRFFISFVGWGTIFSWVTIAFCLAHIGIYAQRNGISFGSALNGRWQERTAFAAFIYAVLAMPYPGSLFIYHIFLMGRGETTREYLNSHKFAPEDRHRPYAMPRMLQNLANVLARPRGPSYLEFKRRYVEGDLRLGYTTPRSERRREVEKEKVARESRVKELMNRFSVAHYQGQPGGQQPKSAVEMKSLPPVPPTPPMPRSSHSRLREFGIGVNNTPR